MSKFECKICRNGANNESFVAREMMFGLRDEFVYFQCSSCLCLQIDNFPENISKYYAPENYYSFNYLTNRKYNSIRGYLYRSNIRANVLQDSVTRKVNQYISNKREVNFLSKTVNSINSRILDVGCGNGQKFLYPLFESGFKNVTGCDPFIGAEIKYENGLKISKTFLSDVKEEFDIVCFNHSFEHIGNPLETLKLTHKLLPRGGYCVIRIPTVSYAWKHYGVNWFQLDAPRHYFIHSKESIEFLAKEANFKLEDCSYDSTHHQFTISERYKRNKSMNERVYNSLSGRFYHIFQKLNYSLKARKLNSKKMGDQAIFYLLKN